MLIELSHTLQLGCQPLTIPPSLPIEIKGLYFFLLSLLLRIGLTQKCGKPLIREVGISGAQADESAYVLKRVFLYEF